MAVRRAGLPAAPALSPAPHAARDGTPRPARADAPGEAGAAQATPPAGPWTVSVGSLCEFSARQGDLDRRFTPSATALEGLAGQAAVAQRRGADYQTELPLQTVVGALRVRGRADGWCPQRRCLEEVKTIRGHPDALPDNRRALHWAQLQTYGALYCRQHGLAGLKLALVYYDIASQTEWPLQQDCSAAELEAALLARCAAYADWAAQEAAHRAARDAGLAGLAFPPGDFRPGQRSLAEAVYRAAVKGQYLLAQAPTGIGKTLGTLYPLLRALPGQGIDKLLYLTCKGTGRITALQALQALRENLPTRALRETPPTRALRVVTLVARDAACEHPGQACHGDACPLARGFFDRLGAARQEAADAGWLDPPALRRIALAHGICPYYLGQEMLRWADVLVGDVNHFFDHHGQLWGLAQALDWRVALLVDEAHNLVERTRRMYSAELSLQALHDAAAQAPAGLRAPLGGLQQALSLLADEAEADYQVLPEPPLPLVDALQALNDALAEHLNDQPLATGALLELHFGLQHWLRLIDAFGEHSLLDLQRGTQVLDLAGRTEVLLALRCIVPARHLRARWAGAHTATLFSATLAPADYQRQLLGLPPETAWLDVPPAFDPAHLQVRVARHVSTRYPHRPRSLDALVAVIAAQYRRQPGHYLAFFSSFEYLQQAADRLAERHREVPQWRQARAMDGAAREAFLQRFVPDGRGLGFAVLGGVFAEGVDLPGTRLVGAFIATLGLPPVSPLQDQVQARLDRIFGTGHGYADRVPALHKVVQAAGRVLRTPEDRGTLWLLDDRYRSPEVVALLPAWWGLGERQDILGVMGDESGSN